MLLLDSSYLVDYEDEITQRRTGDARKFMAAHRSEPFAISLVTLGEFAEGFSDFAAVERFLSRFRVVSLSRLIAYRMAELQAGLHHRLGENDAWTAATALCYGCRLVGRDAAFRRVPGLKYVEY